MFKNYEDLSDLDVIQAVNLVTYLIATVPIEKIIVCTVDDGNETSIVIGENLSNGKLQAASLEEKKDFWKAHLQKVLNNI